VVTGAGSGIGRCCAIALVEAGFTAALVGRRREALEATAARTPEGATMVVPADVTAAAEVDAAFDVVLRTYGRVDVLFNNAGLAAPPVPFEELAIADWERVVAVNLTGAFLCAQAAYRCMKAQRPRGGRIINNGSISAHSPRPNSAPYTASKHAITGLTKAIALDGRAYDIACSQIDIGNAATEMTARLTEPRMDVAAVARAVTLMADLPLDSNVAFMTILATKMPFVGRG